MDVKCVRCKGRNFCGRPVCPIMAKISSQTKINLEAKQEFSGKTPNIFVGKHGYPNVNVGLLSTEQYKHHDEPLLWSKENYDIQSIIDLRTSLVNSNFKVNIKSFNDKFLSLSKEVSMSQKPADVEVKLDKKPVFDLSFNQDTMPHGPSVSLVHAKIIENPKVPNKVEKAVSDTDLKASDALKGLYHKGIDEHYLTKLLSVGNLGVGKARKLVPTRWAITAVDDSVGRGLIDEIQDYKEITTYTAYFGSHLGNYYCVLLFPDLFSYELFEMHVSSPDYTTDYETFRGRKDYAFNTAGGYYSVRLALLEKLKEMKRKGGALVLRFITDDYWAPLGVWVTREAARKAMNSPALEFSSKELMLEYAKKLAKKKFGYNINTLLNNSKLLKEKKEQKKLWEF